MEQFKILETATIMRFKYITTFLTLYFNDFILLIVANSVDPDPIVPEGDV